MNNAYRLVTQYFLKKKILTEPELRDFVSGINDEFEFNIVQLLDAIRPKLNLFDLTVVLTRCEVSGVKFYTCTSTVDRQCFSDFPLLSKNQEDAMYILVDSILNDNGVPVGSIDAINLLVGLNCGIGVDGAQDIIKTFVSKRILVESREGCYSLGPYALTGLRNYINQHENIKTCALCTREVVYSKVCKHCGCNFHLYCYKDFQTDKNVNKCPQCHKAK